MNENPLNPHRSPSTYDSGSETKGVFFVIVHLDIYHDLLNFMCLFILLYSSLFYL